MPLIVVQVKVFAPAAVKVDEPALQILVEVAVVVNAGAGSMLSNIISGVAFTQPKTLVPFKATVTVVATVALGAVNTTGLPVVEFKLPLVVTQVYVFAPEAVSVEVVPAQSVLLLAV